MKKRIRLRIIASALTAVMVLSVGMVGQGFVSLTADAAVVYSVGDSIELDPGAQQTVYVNGGSIEAYQVADTGIASAYRIGSGVINLTALAPGSTVLTVRDSEGERKKISVTVRNTFPKADSGDYVRYSVHGGYTTSFNSTSMTRALKVSTGSCITLKNFSLSNYTYVYYFKDENGKYIPMHMVKNDGYFRFTPVKEGKYYIKVKVFDKANGVSASEVFVITANGESCEDELSASLSEKGVGLQLNKSSSIVFPDEIVNTWRSDTALRIGASGNKLFLRGTANGNYILKVITKSGRMYNLNITVFGESKFELSSGVMELDNGKTASAPVKYSASDCTLSYYISNTSIASVDSTGTVKGLSAGETTLTIKSGSGQTQRVKVIVNTATVKLDKTSALLKPGGKMTLSVTLDPGSTTKYEFSSTKPSVATVDSKGAVKALEKGVTYIKVTTSNGKKASCKLFVSDIPEDVTVKYLAVPPTVHVGKTVKVAVTASDTNYNSEITVTSSDKSIATASYKDGYVYIKGQSMGKAYITITLPNGKAAKQFVYSIGNYNDYRTNSMVEKGIDVSCWNDSIDYKALKAAGYTFVIIRAGYGNRLDQKDSLFEKHIKGAKEAGLGIGIYYFSYAFNIADAKLEAQVCCKIIKKYRKDIQYGVYFDYEEASNNYVQKLGYAVNKTTVTAVTVAFCEEIERQGFVAGVYTNTYNGTYLLDMNQISDYLFWYAAPGATKYAFDFDIWQFSFTLTGDGINGYADGDKVFSRVFEVLA